VEGAILRQAMSEENVETLRRSYAAANQGDLETFLATVHPDVEFKSLIAEAEDETFRGHEGVRRWWNEVVLPLGGLQGEPEELRDLGDTVLARNAATYRPGGVEVPQTIWHVVRYRDGLAIWWQFFRTEPEALEAAGLSA
jgi:ketosteroid isomerase-like protein